MEHYLRFYFKFQTYIIAVGSIAGSVMVPIVNSVMDDFRMPLEQWYDFRYMGNVAFVFSAIWFCVGVSFFYGVYKETKKFWYPFIVFFMFELFLLIVRDIILIWHGEHFYYFTFVNPIAALVALGITLHVMLTVVAAGRFFENDPQPRSGTNFVRFKTDSNNGQSPSTNQFENVMSEGGSVPGVY